MANRQDIINRIATKHADLPTKDLEAIVAKTFEYLIEQLASDNRIEIRNFGSFSIRSRKFSTKSLLNAQPNQPARIDNIRVIYYRMGKKVVEKLNR